MLRAGAWGIAHPPDYQPKGKTVGIREELIDAVYSADPDCAINTTLARRIVDTLQARFVVLELRKQEPDDDGQTWFDDYEIRVDHSGTHGTDVYLGNQSVCPSWLRTRATEYLAAAHDAEENA